MEFSGRFLNASPPTWPSSTANSPRTQRWGACTIEGGWYAVLRIPALRPDEETVRDLLDCGVWVHPGYFFGLPDSGWLVLSLLAPVDEFQTGMEALINFLGTNQEPNKFKG